MIINRTSNGNLINEYALDMHFAVEDKIRWLSFEFRNTRIRIMPRIVATYRYKRKCIRPYFQHALMVKQLVIECLSWNYRNSKHVALQHIGRRRQSNKRFFINVVSHVNKYFSLTLLIRRCLGIQFRNSVHVFFIDRFYV